MGRLFPWILPPRGWFQEVSHLRNPFHVVVIFDKCEVVDGSDYTAQRETRTHLAAGVGDCTERGSGFLECTVR